MATVKLATLIIRTLAKPIATRLKNQAAQHETFRSLCMDFAQTMHRSEVKLRTYILGEPAKHIRPLSETRAVENGANMLAEGFLFVVAASLIIGETWRSSRSESKRREGVNDQLDDLGTRLIELATRVDNLSELVESQLHEEQQKNDELAKILDRVLDIGLHGSLSEMPLRLQPLPPAESSSNTLKVATDTHATPGA
ncbi:hypothetical protein AX14_003466 [Amanita brunnescens Koide BX004]|nr:hypothetical protein AX14_003466 [Amanita brunnescens Koide BX004]